MVSRLVRLVTHCLLWVLGLFALVSAATYGLLAIPAVRSSLFSLVVEQLQEATGWTLSVGNIQTITPFQWRLRDVAVTMPGQPSIKAGEMEMKLSPLHLLRGKIYFSDATVRDFTLPPSVRFSLAPGARGRYRPRLHFAPLSLWSVRIAHLEIFHASIPRDYLGHTKLLKNSEEMNLHLHVEGELQASLIKIYAMMSLAIHREESPDQPTLIGLRLYRKGDSMIVKMTSSEDQGLVSHLSGVPTPFYARTKFSLPVWEADSCSTAASCTGSFHVSVGAPLVEHFLNQWSLFGKEQVTVEGNYTFYPNGSFTVSELKLYGKDQEFALILHGMLEVDPTMKIQKGEFSAEIEDLSIFHKFLKLPLEGFANLTFRASGHFGTPSISLALSGEEIFTYGYHLGALKLRSELRIRSNIVVSTIFFEVADTQLACNASWNYGPAISLERIRLQLPTALLEGSLAVKLDDFSLVGALRGHVEDISQLPFINQWQIEGKADLLAEWRPENAKALHLSLLIYDAHLDPFRSAEVALDLELSDYLTQPSMGRLKIASKELLIGNALFKEITFETSLEPGLLRWPFRFSTNGRWEERFKLTASGEFNPFAGSISVLVASAEGMVSNHPLKLEDTWYITPNKNGVDISPLNVAIGEGTLGMQMRIDRHEVEATLGFQLVPVELLHPLFPNVPVSGTMTGAASLKGSLREPRGQFQISFKQLKTNNPSLFYLKPLNAEFKGFLKDRQLYARGSCLGIGDHPIDVEAILPIDFSLQPYQFDMDRESPLSIRMKANGEFSPIFQILFPKTASVTGAAKMAVEITGSLSSPRIEGKLDLQDCTYESFELGCVIGAIQAHFEGNGACLVLKSFEANDGQNGTVTGQGSLRLDAAANFPYEATFLLNNTMTLRRDFIEAVTSGSLHLSGNREGSLLKGNLTVNRALVAIPKQLPAPSNHMEVTMVNSPKKNLAPIIVEGPPTRLDVHIDCPKNWQIRAEELRSEWRGHAHVIGDTNNPLFYGELKAIRGDFRINGRSFFLDRGAISFAGDLQKKTTLNVTASQDIDRIQVQALLKGPLQHPSLTFSSNPPMSQREILSWVVFNHGLNHDTDTELTGQAIVDLTSKSGSSTPGLLNSLKRLGIDRIDFDHRESHGENDVSVNIGKYIFRDLYVNYNKGITTESNKVSVEAHVIRDVKFKAEVDDEAAGKMLLMWKHNY